MELNKKLNDNLKDFKKIYLDNVEKYLKKEFNSISLLTEKTVIESRGYADHQFAKGAMRHTKSSFAYWNKISNIKHKGLDSYISKGILNAELNFEKSINKVVDKCKNKGLDIDSAKVIYYGIGNDGNPTFDVTDTKKSVYCKTIIAFGEIQIPHYRFLIQ
jgi:hypothetical protein